MKDESSAQAPKQTLRKTDVVCCGVLEKLNLKWMVMEDGTKCMPFIHGKDGNMYRVNVCPSCGVNVRNATI